MNKGWLLIGLRNSVWRIMDVLINVGVCSYKPSVAVPMASIQPTENY